MSKKVEKNNVNMDNSRPQVALLARIALRCSCIIAFHEFFVQLSVFSQQVEHITA